MTRLAAMCLLGLSVNASAIFVDDGGRERLAPLSAKGQEAYFREITRDLPANVGKTKRLQLREAGVLGQAGCHVFKSLTAKGEAALEYAQQAEEARIAEKDLFYATKMFNASAQAADMGAPVPTQADLEQVQIRAGNERARLEALARVVQNLGPQVKKDADFERRACPGDVNPRPGMRY